MNNKNVFYFVAMLVVLVLLALTLKPKNVANPPIEAAVPAASAPVPAPVAATPDTAAPTATSLVPTVNPTVPAVQPSPITAQPQPAPEGSAANSGADDVPQGAEVTGEPPAASPANGAPAPTGADKGLAIPPSEGQ